MNHVKKNIQVSFGGFNDNDQQVVSGFSSQYNILCIWEVSTKWSKIMFANIRKVSTTDGYHMQISSHGNIFGFGIIDANDQMLCLKMSLCYNNNS